MSNLIGYAGNYSSNVYHIVAKKPLIVMKRNSPEYTRIKHEFDAICGSLIWKPTILDTPPIAPICKRCAKHEQYIIKELTCPECEAPIASFKYHDYKCLGCGYIWTDRELIRAFLLINQDILLPERE